MFFWVLFAALVCSQVSRIYHASLVGLNDFTISDDQICEWISELDSSADAYSGSSGSARSGKEVDSEFDFWISADAATAEQMLSHLSNAVVAKAESEGWEINKRGGGWEMFHFTISKGASRFKIYCWVLSTGKSSDEDRRERQGKNVFRVIAVQNGYAHS